MKNADFNSDANFNHFVRNISKTRFFINTIKTVVHRAENIVLCGRHRISHIFINAKICSIAPPDANRNNMHGNIMITTCFHAHQYNADNDAYAFNLIVFIISITAAFNEVHASSERDNPRFDTPVDCLQ